MISKFVTSQVEEALRLQSAVAIIGPRQVGKTTLALEVAKSRGAIYLDLENSEDRARLASPALYFKSTEDKLVIPGAAPTPLAPTQPHPANPSFTAVVFAF